MRSSNFNNWRLNYTSSHVELFQRLYYLVCPGLFKQIIKHVYNNGFLSLSLPASSLNVLDMSEITRGSWDVMTILAFEPLFLFHEENLFPILGY